MNKKALAFLFSTKPAAFPPRARLGKDADTKMAKGIFAQRATFFAPSPSYSLARSLALRTVPAVVVAAEAAEAAEALSIPALTARRSRAAPKAIVM